MRRSFYVFFALNLRCWWENPGDVGGSNLGPLVYKADTLVTTPRWLLDLSGSCCRLWMLMVPYVFLTWISPSVVIGAYDRALRPHVSEVIAWSQNVTKWRGTIDFTVKHFLALWSTEKRRKNFLWRRHKVVVWNIPRSIWQLPNFQVRRLVDGFRALGASWQGLASGHSHFTAAFAVYWYFAWVSRLLLPQKRMTGGEQRNSSFFRRNSPFRYGAVTKKWASRTENSFMRSV